MTTRTRTRTLILDDEMPVVNMLSRICEQEGHVVRPFTRPLDALQCLAHEPIDMLITDLNMGDLDGITVTQEAWRRRSDLYVLIITGHAIVSRRRKPLATPSRQCASGGVRSSFRKSLPARLQSF